MRTVMEAYGISKYFPGVKALSSVDFDLRAGEVHILVGENGAGKSTLAKCLLGAYMHEEGKLILEGEEVKLSTAKDAIEKGIVAVYQEFTLIPYLSVAQNIFLNRECKSRFGLVDKRKMEEEAKEILNTLGCDYIDVRSSVKKLSIAQQQMVEIAKALSFSPKIIVFDEPTATLSEREINLLFKKIHNLKEQGIGIIYVSHRMQEFDRIGDRITILRDGHKIATVGIKDHTNEELVNMMVGRDISQVFVRNENNHQGEILKTVNLCDKKDRVKSVNINLQKGEIVGIAGLVGAGRTELARLIFGIEQYKSGQILINGEPITNRNSPVKMVKQKMGFVSEDRKKEGLALRDSIAWNIMAVSLKKYFKRGFINYSKMNELCIGYKKKLSVVAPGVETKCKNLSGGNQQKVVLAKWISAEPEIIIFDEPTRGIDVGAKMEIYKLMDALASEGKSILMISSELLEVIGMSDRIYTMHEGKITAEFKRENSDFNAELIGLKMMGLGGL